MNVLRSIATITAVTALTATGAASAADAPTVSAQDWTVGSALVDIPGTGIHKGDYMGAGARLVSKTVELEAGQSATVTLRASGDRRIAGAAVAGSSVGASVVDRDYVGTRKVTLRLRLSGKAPAGEHAV